MAKFVVEVENGCISLDDLATSLVPFDKCRPSWWDEAYKQGLKDAWEAARKIETTSVGELAEIFDDIFDGYDDVMYVCSRTEAQEAIAKISEHEKKKEAAKLKVGDEVIYDGRKRIVITVDKPGGRVQLMGVPGATWTNIELPIKTGRHFPQIVEVLKQLHEPQY